MAAPACFRATYTVDGHKKLRKNWRWLDGFVSQQDQVAKLYDEGGSVVGTGRLAAGLALEEGLELDHGQFGQSIIVTVDVPCSPSDIHAGSSGADGDGQQVGAGSHAAPAAPAGVAGAAPTKALAPVRALPRPVGTTGLRPSGSKIGAVRRPAFRAPRATPGNALADATVGMAVQQPMQQPGDLPWVQPGRRQFVPPPQVQPAAAPAASAPGGASAAMRSDADILRLLMGQGVAAQPPAPQAPPVEEPPAAKRARVQPPHAPSSAAPVPASLPSITAAPPKQPKWSSFLEEEEVAEDLGQELEALTGQAGGGSWSSLPAGEAAPESCGAAGAAAKQWKPHQKPPFGGGSAGLHGGMAPAQPPAVAPAAAEEDMGGWDALSPGSSGGRPAFSDCRPIVRPAQLSGLAGAQPAPCQLPGPGESQPPRQARQAQQQQKPWGSQQRLPLHPNRRAQPVQRQQPQQPGAGAPGGGAKQWKPPAVTRLPAAAVPGSVSRHGHAATQPHIPAAVSGWNRVVDGTVQLGWPTAEEAARPQRRVVVPDSFASAHQYVQVWTNVLLEELNLRIAEVAQGFHTAAARASQQQQLEDAGSRRPGGGRKAAGTGCSGLEACMRQARVPYYSHCELFIWRNNMRKKGGGGGGGRKGGKRRRDEDSDGGEDGVEEDAKPDTFYLILKSGRQKSAEYRKDDLWVISSTPDFRSPPAPGQPADRSRAPWLAVARSAWHGPNQDGKFEIEFLSPKPAHLGRSQAVYAIKGPDASTELGMIDLLRSGEAAATPLLPHLLRTPRGSSATPRGHGVQPLVRTTPGSSAAAKRAQQAQQAEPDSPSYSCTDDEGDEAAAAAAAAADGLAHSPLVQAEQIAKRFRLNEEQAEVLQYVAGWCQPGGSGAGGSASKAGGIRSPAQPPVCLVHGPFGSGKSTLLVALLHFLLQQRSRKGSPLSGARVLVAAHTNVAVDRVLLGLLESGCTDFLRVGPLRRLSRRLLGQSLHASESRASATAAAELREMLKEAGAAGERAAIQQELAAVENGADRQRRRLLKTVPIVGVTCCSSTLAVLDGQRFDVLVLDEASQMVEPLSAVPLLRARARFLIAAGDPLQLPPVVASPANVSPSGAADGHHGKQQQQQQQQQGSAGAAQLHGLLRPLFVRLAALGLPPFLLRRQYRCHPDISAVPNAHFYSGRLRDGVTREQRASLLPGLPSLAFLDVRGQETNSSGRSASNQAEAEAVVGAVERLVAAGVRLGQCGVICIYRAQVALVRSLLERRLPQLQAQEQRCRRSTSSAGEGAGSGDEDEGDRGVAEGQHQGIQVATVDSFQGAECDAVILTTAITRPGAFASDACRLNVALTRARHNLLIVGCAPALQQSAPAFAALLARCRATPGGYHPGGRLPPQAALAAQQAAAAGAAAAVPERSLTLANPPGRQQAHQQTLEDAGGQASGPCSSSPAAVPVAAAAAAAGSEAAGQPEEGGVTDWFDYDVE